LTDIYGVKVDDGASQLSLADYFDIHLDHAPKVGATLVLDTIVLVVRSLSGDRVNVIGLRLPEEEDEVVSRTWIKSLKNKLAEFWTSVAGI